MDAAAAPMERWSGGADRVRRSHPLQTRAQGTLAMDHWSWSESRLDFDRRSWEHLLGRLQSADWPRPQRIEGLETVCLDGGMGPAIYLRADGRVAVVDEGPTKARRRDGYRGLAVAARRSGIPEFLALLPKPSSDAVTCSACKGARYAPRVGWGEVSFVCDACDGLGWIAPSTGDD